MSGNLRGRLTRLEKSAAAGGPSIMTNGVFWDMVGGEPGPYTPAELAEWDAVCREAEERAAAEDPAERRITDLEGRAFEPPLRPSVP